MTSISPKFLFVVLFIASQPILVAQSVLHVDHSYSGAEGSDGSLQNPFNTIQDAADQATEGTTIYIHEGIYREEVQINTENITLQAYGSDSVLINGADPLYQWELIGNGVYRTIMSWDIQEYDYTNQIFVDGHMLELARWPKEESTDPISRPTMAQFESAENNGNFLILEDKELDTPERWVGAKVSINPSNPIYRTDGQGWTGDIYKIEGRTIYTDPELPTDGGPYSVGRETLFYAFDPKPAQVYATGGPEALLDTGEWWKHGDTLFVKTFNGQEPASGSGAVNLVEAKKRLFGIRPGETQSLRFVTIKNIALFGCSVTTENLYNSRTALSKSQNVTLDNIRGKYLMHTDNLSGNFQHQWSTNMGLIIQGINHTVKNSSIHYTAGSAISLMGRGHKVINNEFIRCNYKGTEAGIINFGTHGSISEDMEIAYNNFIHSPHNAISMGFLINTDESTPGLARIHHNYFYNMMTQYFDLGVIEQAGNYGGGVRIDHNIIHNDSIADFGIAKAGIYLDFGDHDRENQALYVIDNNLIYNIENGVLMAHLRGAKVYNNTIYAAETNDGRIALTANRMSEDGQDVEIINNLITAIDGGYGSAIFSNNVQPDSIQWENWVTNAEAGNFELTDSATSLINTGDTIPDFLMPSDGQPDIGAIEKGEQIKAGFEDEPNQYPYLVLPYKVTDTIPFVHFDEGGYQVAYFDKTKEDSSNIFRNTSVDIVKSVNGDTVLLIDAEPGEWLEYTLTIPNAGLYELEVNLQSPNPGSIYFMDKMDTIAVISHDSTNEWNHIMSQSFTLERGLKTIRLGFESAGSAFDYFTFTPVDTLSVHQLNVQAIGGYVEINANDLYFDEGDSVMIIARPDGGNAFEGWSGDLTSTRDTLWVNFNSDVSLTANFITIPQSPYGGVPWPIPGKIEFEDYDEGGFNVAYFDNSPANLGSSNYRNDSVDIQENNCGSLQIGFIGRDEWREYTVDIKEPGSYDIEVSTSADLGFGGEFVLNFEKGGSSGIIEVTPSGGWRTCKLTAVKGVELDSGIQIMRVTPLSGGHNQDYVKFTKSDAV